MEGCLRVRGRLDEERPWEGRAAALLCNIPISLIPVSPMKLAATDSGKISIIPNKENFILELVGHFMAEWSYNMTIIFSD